MTTQIEDDIGQTLVNVKSTLSLSLGTTYVIHNLGPSPMILIEAASTPTDERGFSIQAGETWTVEVGADNIYLKSGAANGTCVAAVNDAQ